MWTYQIGTGKLYGPDSKLVGVGYSGRGLDLNNPASVGAVEAGPIPPGFYTMGPWFTHPEKGPVVTRLTPHPTNHMRGRAGFMIHGDNEAMDHTASDGCVILARVYREALAASPDQILEVEGSNSNGEA